MKHFAYVKDKKIYDQNNQELLLQGVGLGGWMLPEGYMWGSHGYYERPRRFEELISYYMGDKATEWWKTYYKTWISDDDFTLIKQHGYNSVRLPIDYRLLMEENDTDTTVVLKEFGFDMIDYTIAQCKKNQLYLILDMHGAPGGQTGANIDDSKDDYPHLYEQKIYQDQLIQLWEEIARRYKNETTICMYDLINEPIPEKFNHLNQYLEPLHDALIKAIRAIDPNHIICVEGNNWASDFSTITRKLAENTVLHFHKYWNPPSIEQIQRFLDKREELNMPLFMGEGGENDLYWYSSNFKMYEQLDIGWNFWAYKKRNNHNSIISFNLPNGWNRILDPKHPLPIEEGRKLLNTFLENIQFKNCNINLDVTNHLFYKDDFFTTGGLYDYLGSGKSFYVTRKHNGSTIRNNDQTNICDKQGNTFHGVWGCHNEEQQKQELFPYVKANSGDFYNYTFRTTFRKTYHIFITHSNLEGSFLINQNLMNVERVKEGYVIHFYATQEVNVLTIKPSNQGIILKIKINSQE